MNPTWALKNVSLYTLLREDGQAEWAHHLVQATCAKGKVIFSPGDPGEMLYMIDRGTVRIYRLSPEGREVTFAILGPGDVFGELALVNGYWQSAFAEVLDEATLTLLPGAVFHTVLEQRPEIAFQLMVSISQRLRQAEDFIEDLVHRDVTARVARTLLQLADSFGRFHTEGVTIDLRLPYQEIANMVGSTRETVTRAIGQMQQNNWVRFESGLLHIHDQEALRTLAA